MPALPLPEIHNALNGLLARVCADVCPGTPISWHDSPLKDLPSVIWIRQICKTGKTDGYGEKGQHGLSKRPGVYLVDVFAPVGIAPQEARELAGKIETAFRRGCAGGVVIDDPWSEDISIKNEPFCVRVTVPFWCWSGK